MRYKSNKRSIERLFDISPRSLSMSVSTLQRPATEPRALSVDGRTAPAPAPAPVRPLRPHRRSGRRTGPDARPARRPTGTVLARSRALPARSCQVASPAVAVRPAHWRLTDRGIALVLVVGLLICTAALAVVTLTALRVTGVRYHGAGESLGGSSVSSTLLGGGAAAGASGAVRTS